MIRKGDSSILELKNIVKRFGELTAVNDVSLDLERGKLVTFLGPSGCGKTTLLRVVSGFTIPDEGKVILDGVDITDLQPNARDTAMVFQNYALFPHMTVAANIGFGLKIMKKTKREVDDEVERLLTLVQMEGLGDRRPHELSGGQQQRVALARALSLRPKILLLDEPLSNLDANLRMLMRGEIRKLHRRLGLSIIFVTHDQEEAMSLSDELVVMDHGIVKQVGSPTQIYETPVDEFVARFIGHPACKVVAVRPEAITLTPLADALSFTGRITQSSMLGSVIRYQVDCAGQPISYEVVNLNAKPLRIGDTATFYLRDEDLLRIQN